MQQILVSACLLGQRVRYDGSDLRLDDALLRQWEREGRLVPLCPEMAGGLPAPRVPAEIAAGGGGAVLDAAARVINASGHDVTNAFLEGARQALQLCQRHDIRLALLTESSPSCGSHRINNGEFSGTKVPGMGVTTALLRRHGIDVFSQFQLAELAQVLASS